jgi:hypothetical protein
VCGCEWRDKEIARYVAHIEALRNVLRVADPGCELLPENWETDDHWEREAMRVVGRAGPGMDTSLATDHGVVRRLP